MLRGVLTIGGWTMASRILGLAREMLIAALVGTGPVADAFFVALRLPNLFRRLFGEGAFNVAFVPAFTGLLHAEGVEPARRFATEALGVMVFWLGCLTILGEVFMPQVMAALAPGFTDEPAKFALVVTYGRITFPYVFLICLTALLSGVLNGLERFAAAAAAPVLFNLFSIAAMLLLIPHVPTAGHALAWGVTLSGVAQLGLVAWAVRRAGLRLSIPRPRMTPAMRVLLRRMGPGLLGAGVFQLNLMMDTVIGSLLPAGSIALLNYADRVNQLPLGTIGFAIGTALLPLLTRQVREADPSTAITTMNRALEYALFLTLPAAVALGVAGVPIMHALFVRGAFTATDAILSAQSLAAYAVGLPAAIVVKVLAPGFFARGDTATPVKIGVAAVALNLALNLAFMGPLKHVGPALASSLSTLFNVVALGVVLTRRGQFRLDPQLRRRAPRMAAAAVAMGAALWAAMPLLPGGVAGLALLVAGGAAVYGVAVQLSGGFDVRRALPRRPPRG